MQRSQILQNMTENFSFRAKKANIRLDHFLTKQFPKKSRSKIQAAIRLGHIQVNDLVVKPSFILKETDKIAGEFINELLPQDIIPEDIPLDIIYEDGHIVVVNKSSGPTSINFFHTIEVEYSSYSPTEPDSSRCHVP